MPAIMIIELVYHVTMWLNNFPSTNSVGNFVPRTFFTGTQLSFDKHCWWPFGSFVQTHEEGSNNNATERTMDAVCLDPSGNVQGTYKFLNLATNQRIHRNEWAKVPAPDWVILRVNDLERTTWNNMI